MGLTSFLFRSLSTSELKIFNEAVAPLQGTLTATGGIKTAGIINDNIPAYINTEPMVGTAKLLIADWDGAYYIHQWFVENVQDGMDDCGYYEVSYEELETLLEVLEAVNKDNAKELLPNLITEEYDEDYWESIKNMKELARYLLNNFDWGGCSLLYSSSW